MRKHFLVNVTYDNNKSKVVCYFSKDLDNINKYDYIHTEKFNPWIVTDIQKELVKKLLYDFSKDVVVTQEKENTKIKAKDFETLEKCKKILQLSTNKNILMIEPERQFLVNNDWGYYDSYCLVSNNKINKIEESPLTNINYIIKNMIDQLELKIESRIQRITNKILLTNYLKKKIDANISRTQAVNYLFENCFFKKSISQPQESIAFLDKQKEVKEEGIKINLTKTWAYFLIKKENNIGYETIDCSCCKPKEIYDDNTLPHSLVEVEFIKNGFYFLSKDFLWAYDYHNNNKDKDKRERYKKQNNVRDFPVGPFFKKDKAKILLIDAIDLYERKEIKILKNHEYKWFCKNRRSFVSEAIEQILKTKKVIDRSIELTTKLNYSNNKLEKIKELEKNTLYLVYQSERKLYNYLLEEIIAFIQNKNTKFYVKKVDQAVKSLKQKTYESMPTKECRYNIRQEILTTKDKSIVEKINNYFTKINIPIPEIFL